MTDMTDPRQTALAQTLPATVPFVAPERMEELRGAPFDARLGANELSFGPSPKALEAMTASLSGVWTYGEPENRDLRLAIAARHGITPESVTVGEGIDGLLGNLVRLYVGPGETVVTSAGSYPTFNYHVAGFGGALHTVPYKNDHEDPEALISKAREVGAKLVYLSNPNNPMGSVHSAQTVQDMIEAVPEGCLMILDEAYSEFAPESTRPAIDVTDRRVIRFRTFSKAYGMAGARIGYGIAHPVVATAFDNTLWPHLQAQLPALYPAHFYKPVHGLLHCTAHFFHSSGHKLINYYLQLLYLASQRLQLMAWLVLVSMGSHMKVQT